VVWPSCVALKWVFRELCFNSFVLFKPNIFSNNTFKKQQ